MDVASPGVFPGGSQPSAGQLIMTQSPATTCDTGSRSGLVDLDDQASEDESNSKSESNSSDPGDNTGDDGGDGSKSVVNRRQ